MFFHGPVSLLWCGVFFPFYRDTGPFPVFTAIIVHYQAESTRSRIRSKCGDKGNTRSPMLTQNLALARFALCSLEQNIQQEKSCDQAISLQSLSSRKDFRDW